MKVQIIYLDPHDDHVSARDKLGWAQAPRVLVVWPSYGNVLNRRLDLVLLRRHAQQQSTQIGLVTLDPIVIDIAKSLSIPVFDSVDDVTESGWRRSARGRPRKSRLTRRQPTERPTPPEQSIPDQKKQRWMKIARPILVILAITAILLSAAIVFPSARIALKLPTEIQEIDLILYLDPEIESPSSGNRIPAILVQARVTADRRIPTSGRITIPTQFASGEVIFTNNTSDPVTIPEGTGLRSSDSLDQRYVTTIQVDLPAEEGAQVNAVIEAVLPGPSSNLPENSIDAVEGPLGILVSVDNPSPISGGGNQVRMAVAPSDHSNLERELISHLMNEAAIEIAASLNMTETLIQESLHTTTIHREVYDHLIGDVADSVSLLLDFEVEGYAFRPEDIASAASAALANATPESHDIVPDTFKFDILSISADPEDEMQIQVHASQEIFASIDENRLREMVRGQTLNASIARLERKLELASEPEIILVPAWLSRLPWLTMRISFRYIW